MTGTSNASIRTMDMPILDEVFVMGDGFVLDFSNRTFADFFREELQVDIDHPRWEAQGGSKARRLRYYLRQADRRTALDTLNALWEYRETSGVTHDYPTLEATVTEIVQHNKTSLMQLMRPSQTLCSKARQAHRGSRSC